MILWLVSFLVHSTLWLGPRGWTWAGSRPAPVVGELGDVDRPEHAAGHQRDDPDQGGRDG